MSRRRPRSTPAPSAPPTPPARQKTPPPPPAPARPAPRAVQLPTPPWRTHVLPLATTIGLAFILYTPCFEGDFVYDDPNAISQSGLVRSLWPILPFLTLSTRPLTDYSYAIDYAIGGLDTTSFHVSSVLLHCANVALLYAIAWMTLGLPALAARFGQARREIAWAAAALFAVHPLASETVAYISSRSEVLVAFWYLLAVAAYASAVSLRRGRQLATIIVPLAAAAALGSKEIAVTLPLALLLYQWLLVAQGDWRRMRLDGRLLALATLPLAIGGLVLLVRAYVNPIAMGQYGATAGLGFDRFSRWEYLLTQFGVIVHYLRLVIFPVGQTFDYDWPLARTLFAPGVLLPLVLLAALVYVAWRQARAWPLFAFAVAWTLVILAPTSSVMPIADLAVERRMYLPLAMIALCAAAALYQLAQYAPAAQRAFVFPLLVLVPLAGFSVGTWQRATLWGDAIALHEDGVAKAPNNPRTRLNLGVTYLNTGDPEKAYTTLVEAKRLYDSGESVHAFARIGAFIHYNLGAVLFARGQPDLAAPQLKRSLELGGQYLALRPMAYMLLSRIAANHENWEEADANLTEALKFQDNPDWRVDLAEYRRRSGKVGARMILEQTLQLHPNHARAQQALKALDAAQGKQ